RNAGSTGSAPPAQPAAPVVTLPRPPSAAPTAASMPDATPDADSHAARLFFTFLEPFFVDDAPENVHLGRLARAAAAPIWAWIGRDLLPAETRTFAAEVAR